MNSDTCKYTVHSITEKLNLFCVHCYLMEYYQGGDLINIFPMH